MAWVSRISVSRSTRPIQAGRVLTMPVMGDGRAVSKAMPRPSCATF